MTEAGEFTHLPECSPSVLPLYYMQCCTVELGTQPAEPKGLALILVPDSEPQGWQWWAGGWRAGV